MGRKTLVPSLDVDAIQQAAHTLLDRNQGYRDAVDAEHEAETLEAKLENELTAAVTATDNARDTVDAAQNEVIDAENALVKLFGGEDTVSADPLPLAPSTAQDSSSGSTLSGLAAGSSTGEDMQAVTDSTAGGKTPSPAK